MSQNHSAYSRTLYRLVVATLIIIVSCGWGFQGHKLINEMAIYLLPPDMLLFYKKHLMTLRETAVNPDKRRYVMVDEAPRHYIDLDHYVDSTMYKRCLYWRDALKHYPEDTLKANGILPWHVYKTFVQLRDAFIAHDEVKIIKLSSDLGHYIGDAHVPLHTTKNYNGQLTGQDGIHGLWESRLVELHHLDYNYVVGKAQYISHPQQKIWEVIMESYAAKDSVLLIEKQLAHEYQDKRFNYQSKGNQAIKVYSKTYCDEYHQRLNRMVERRLRSAIKITSGFWYTAWVDAGQPDLSVMKTLGVLRDTITSSDGSIKANTLKGHE